MQCLDSLSLSLLIHYLYLSLKLFLLLSHHVAFSKNTPFVSDPVGNAKLILKKEQEQSPYPEVVVTIIDISQWKRDINISKVSKAWLSCRDIKSMAM